MHLKVVDWNVNGFVTRTQPELLASLEWDVACLQEVTRETWASFRALGSDGGVAFDHLPPLAGAGPRYACGIVVRGALRIEHFEVLPDVPSPERAAVAWLRIGVEAIAVGSWAAPPASGGWGDRGKGRQVQRFAAWLRDRRTPVVIGIDRNAPRWERLELEHDEWWNRDEPLLYGPDRVHDLRDVFRDHLHQNPALLGRIRDEFPDGPLAVTHRRRGIGCRYDAIYASPEFAVEHVEHHWDEARAAGSDHALVEATLRFDSGQATVS